MLAGRKTNIAFASMMLAIVGIMSLHARADQPSDASVSGQPQPHQPATPTADQIFQRAVNHYQAGEWPEAAGTLEHFVATCPGDSRATDAVFFWAESLGECGRDRQAADIYQRFLDSASDSPHRERAMFRAAESRYRSQQFPASESSLNQFCREYPDSPLVRHALQYVADLRCRANDLHASIQIYQRLLQRFPQNPNLANAYLGLAHVAKRAGRLDVAKAAYQDLIRMSPRHRDLAQLKLGLLEYNDKNYLPAVASLTQVVNSDRNPDLRRQALYWRGMSRFASRNFVAAVEDYDLLLLESAESDDIATVKTFREQAVVSAKLLRAQGLAAEGRFEDARNICLEIVRAAGSQPASVGLAAKSQFLIADSYAMQDQQEAALREFLRVDVLYDSESLQAAALFRAARCYEQLHRPAPAKATYARVVKHFPQSEFARSADAELARLISQESQPRSIATSTKSPTSLSSFTGAVAGRWSRAIANLKK